MTVTPANIPAMTPQQARFTKGEQNGLGLYKELAVGNGSWTSFVYSELMLTLFSNTSGILGLGFRSVFYPRLFRKVLGRLAIGKGVVIRIPKAISIGRGVLVDDYACLDVRGEGSEINIEDHVVVGRYSTIAAKGGRISLGKGSNIGSYCRLATQTKITLGESVLIGAYAYIGPGNHTNEGDDLISAPMQLRGGVSIGSHSWIGAGALIMDGVSIGERCIIGAQSLVREDVPDGTTVVGSPARVLQRSV